ncbi:MAG: 2-isopropylmalate synthase, partial [Pseudomonadota bacterium]
MTDINPDKIMPLAEEKYRAYDQVDISERTWPNNTITEPPVWCSVDLRDGNQALIDPMGQDRKERMFRLLLDMKFKEIEIGFPSASQTDFDFARWCVEQGEVPDDVSLQVLVQC